MAEILLNQLLEIIALAFEECCIQSVSSDVSSLAMAREGVYSAVNVSGEGFLVQTWVPEDTPNNTAWDGVVKITYKGMSQSVKVTELIDTIQSGKDGNWPNTKG